MDIITTKKEALLKYEETLLRRDNLRGEAERYQKEYNRVFGELVTESFEKKIECIRKKKMITYCLRKLNMGRKVDAYALNIYVTREMAEYENELYSVIDDVRAAGKIEQENPGLPAAARPEKAASRPEETVARAKGQAANRDIALAPEHAELELDDLNGMIAGVEEEIRRITTTAPYLYKALLEDDLKIQRKKQEYQEEIASSEMYSAQLDAVLSTITIERKLS